MDLNINAFEEFDCCGGVYVDHGSTRARIELAQNSNESILAGTRAPLCTWLMEIGADASQDLVKTMALNLNPESHLGFANHCLLVCRASFAKPTTTRLSNGESGSTNCCYCKFARLATLRYRSSTEWRRRESFSSFPSVSPIWTDRGRSSSAANSLHSRFRHRCTPNLVDRSTLPGATNVAIPPLS